MRIAILGTRGIPARYGGFETCAEEVGVRLVQEGHEVIVYCRKGNYNDSLRCYKGIILIHLPSIRSKITETFTHTLFSMFHVLFLNVDIIYVMNAANSLLCIIPKIFGQKIIINVDGLEWKRKKWGFIGRAYYLFAERMSTILANRIISDSMGIYEYYLARYMTKTDFIAYGAHIETSENPEILKEYNLEPDSYFFVASRLEPENNADITVRAFKNVNTYKKLVIAGGANYKSKYIKSLIEESRDDNRIIFLGPVYKEGHIKELHCNCYAYIHGNEVGGTNPALLKALGYGNAVLALDVNFNSEVTKDAGILYKKSALDLAKKIQYLVDNPCIRNILRNKAIKRIKEAYTWDYIASQYNELFLSL